MKYDDYFIEKFKKPGANIRKIREAKQITIKELSKKTGIRVEYIRKIEQGKAYGVLIEKHILKIANALSIKMSELFSFDS